MIKRRDTASATTIMRTSMQDRGRTTKEMERWETCSIKREIGTVEPGNKTINMEKARFTIRMDRCLKENFSGTRSIWMEN